MPLKPLINEGIFKFFCSFVAGVAKLLVLSVAEPESVQLFTRSFGSVLSSKLGNKDTTLLSLLDFFEN
jgi:hypothetical protein